jgi:hypothetical protein
MHRTLKGTIVQIDSFTFNINFLCKNSAIKTSISVPQIRTSPNDLDMPGIILPIVKSPLKTVMATRAEIK